ncbi:uncharacterized protein LOC141632589 [Silene latifolia]|uniref:uncharacterized protein LOC141632589 n=1 Tax=Silene latifolia TaxID=37657 RepID=UPI003D77C620
MHSIDDSVKNSVSHTENARELWLDLEERFCVVNGARVHAIKAQLHDCRQTKGMSVTSYFGDLKVLWDALSAIELPFACKCGRCTCDIAKGALARQDSERVHKFLMGLDSTLYRTLRSQQLALDPLPSLNRVYHLVLQEERHLSPPAVVEEPSDVMAFVVRRDSSTTNNSSTTAPDWRALRDLERQEKLSSSSQDRLSGMSPHWIIDTGASHHITGDETWLADPYPIPPYPVTLPNGHRVSANIAGTVRLNEFDRSLKTRIGVGEQRDGLYLLRAVVKPTINRVSADSFELCKGDKFAKQSRKCLFLGYPHNKKGWKVLDLTTREIFVSRDVYFYEHSFPYAFATPYPTPPVDDPVIPYLAHGQPEPETVEAGETISDEQVISVATEQAAPNDNEQADTINTEQPNDNAQTISTSSTNTDSGEAPVMGRGKRNKIPSTRLRGFVVGTTAGTSSDSDSSPDSPRSSGTPYALANYLTCTNFSRNHRVFLAAISNVVEPPSFRVAINDPRWCKAMEAEITALENNGTWELADLPSDKKALGCRWVYKIKYKSDGSIERYKARLVIFGNHQVEGIDYGETFAPVIKMVTIRTFLSIAAVKNWELHQMDVHNAFLHGDLDEEVYMKLPPRFSKGKEDKVCRLRKSLYGPRQAPRCWFAKLTAALRKYSFTQSYYDYSLFSYVTTKVCIHVLVYVYDLVIAGNDSVAISNFKAYLGQCFHMKDLGLLKYFLGIEVARNKEGIFLNQRKYALDIISETGLLGAKPALTPIEQHHKLGVATDDFLADSESYRRLVGRLVYLAVTRPDLILCGAHSLALFKQTQEVSYGSRASSGPVPQRTAWTRHSFVF